jgi:hypothetical protein
MPEAHLETDMGDAAFVLSYGKNAGGLHTPAFTVFAKYRSRSHV